MMTLEEIVMAGILAASIFGVCVSVGSAEMKSTVSYSIVSE